MKGLDFGSPLLLIATLAAASGRADDQPAQPDAQPPAGVAADPAPAGDTSTGPPREPAADGTTSVVVPSTGDAARSENLPAFQPPPQVPPANAVAAPPPPPADLAQPAPQSEAARLLARMLEPLAATPGRAVVPPEATLYSRPLQLLEALARGGDRSRRLWIVQSYWKVSAAHAAVRSATESLERLELVAPGADPHDRATLDVTTAAARADLAEAHAALGAAQQELVDLARLPAGEPLPWPVDRPLADPYQTHFEAIFANRIATGRVRAIVRSLPPRHQALEARAAAVVAAEKALAMAEADHAKGNRPIEAVVAAHLALVGQQRSFLEAVRTYNLEIAEYAMAVAELSLPDDRFVSMLIGTPIQWRPTATADAVPATAAPPAIVATPTPPPPAAAPE